jgi:CRISPR-associated protein Csm1
MNAAEGSYTNIYKGLGDKLSQKKLRRYGGDAIRKLNKGGGDLARECKECKRSDVLTDEDICPICASLRDISSDIVKKEYFIVKRGTEKNKPPLPGGCCLYAADKGEPDGKEALRFYCKNRVFSDLSAGTPPQALNAINLWLGDYTDGSTFEQLAEKAEGIKRIAALRLDVDDMGRAFISGFHHKKYAERYISLSRTAAFSRSLSLFFKFYLNHLLSSPSFRLKGGDKTGRFATVIYSGGDDVFIVGAWNDALELALEISDSFGRYTQGTLTLSGGIGIYNHSYPIARIAFETGAMESAAKHAAANEKNRVSLFTKAAVGIYRWTELKEKVIDEKLTPISDYFSRMRQSDREQGKTMLNNLLSLITEINESREPINIARLAYYLSRLAPLSKNKEEYSNFSKSIYGWTTDEITRRELISAITLYLYLERKKGGLNV